MQFFFTALVQLALISGLAAGVTKHLAFPTRSFTPNTNFKPALSPKPFKKKFRPTMGQLTIGYAFVIDGVTTGFLLSLGLLVLVAAGVALRHRRRLALALVPFTTLVRRSVIRRPVRCLPQAFRVRVTPVRRPTRPHPSRPLPSPSTRDLPAPRTISGRFRA